MQERIHKLKVMQVSLAAVLQPHFYFFSVLLIMYIYLIFNFMDILTKYPLLDPTTFRFPEINGTTPADIRDYHIPGFLRWMSMACPVFIGLTFGVTITHLWRHFPFNRGFDDHLRWFPSYSHDLAMQVVALPLVYGVFALDSTRCMLKLMTGDAYKPDGTRSWSSVEDDVNQTYSINFQLADLYEAWALRSFGVLCFVRVSRQIRLEAPTVKYIIETVRAHFAGVQTAGSRDRMLMEDLIILNSPEELLFEPLQQTAGIGVMVFVYTYALKSVYLLSLGLLADEPFNIQLCGNAGKFPAMCSFIPYVDGAAFLASTLAIYNMVVFEHNLKAILKRENFKPFEKFLCVKMLVSIAFLQDFAMTVVIGSVLDFSKQQVNLCYTCLICFEVFPISVLVFWAWRPTPNDWYAGDRHPGQVLGEGLATGQLADEKVSEDSHFAESRQLTAMVGSARCLNRDAVAAIELHGNVCAQEGKALEELVNTMSRTMTAVYKPAALFNSRSSSPRGERAVSTLAPSSLRSLSSMDQQDTSAPCGRTLSTSSWAPSGRALLSCASAPSSLHVAGGDFSVGQRYNDFGSR